MSEIKIDEELVNAISILVTGAMSTGNQKLLPAINKATSFLNIVIENSKNTPTEEKTEPIEEEEE